MNQNDNSGNTPLHLAVLGMAEGPTYRISVDSLKLAEMLISAGADYLITDKHGNSILHLLAAGLKIEDERGFFEQMVQRGMDVNGRNELGETPLFSFCRTDKLPHRIEGFKYQSNAITMFKRLGADLFATDHKGRGLLHAAAGGEAELFKELLDCGLDAGLEDDV